MMKPITYSCEKYTPECWTRETNKIISAGTQLASLVYQIGNAVYIINLDDFSIIKIWAESGESLERKRI